MTGKERRLRRIFPDKKTVIVPVDDSLIFGPLAGLSNIQEKLKEIVKAKPDAILAHKGTYLHHGEILKDAAWILNLSASTVLSQHTRKVLVDDVYTAASLDAQAVAVHLNLSSKFESEMLKHVSVTVREAEKLGLPVLVIAYPRKEAANGDYNYLDLKDNEPHKFSALVSHCVRVAKDLGADIVKTQHTNLDESYSQVIQAGHPLPIVIAGGAVTTSQHALDVAEHCISKGASGVSYGRNVFSRVDTTKFVNALSEVVHGSGQARIAFEKFTPKDDVSE